MLNKIMGFFASVFDGLVALFDPIIAVILDVVIFVFDILGAIFNQIIVGLINLLPDMPTEVGGQLDFSAFGFANNYIPISEAVALLPVWVTVYAGVGIYKLVKLVRG